jgi:hypothetical protein
MVTLAPQVFFIKKELILLEKNLTALKLTNPALAEKLLSANFNNIEVLQSLSGDYNIAYCNLPLHSTENPIAEAETLFQQKADIDAPNTIFIVYGLGMGYLLKRLFLSSQSKIIVFEPCMDVLRFTMEFVDFSQELCDHRIIVCTEIDEVMSYLEKKFIVGDVIDFLMLPSYMKLETKSLELLAQKVIALVETKKIDQGTVFLRSKKWGYVCLNNLECILRALPVNLLENKFNDTPVVIASAGPGLDENIDLIKQHRNKFVLITINTALRGLIKNDIIPDFCVISEIWGIEDHIKDVKHLDQIRYILHPRAQHISWQLSQHKNFIYLTETDGFACWYNKLLNDKYQLWPSAGTVSILAFYIASKVFNAKNIILTGQDLAFVNNMVYAHSTINDDEHFSIQDDKLKIKTLREQKAQLFKNIKLMKMINYQGEEIYSRKDYIEYAKQYEEIIKKEIPKTTTIINTSLKGLYIEGMIYKDFQSAIKERCSSKIDITPTMNEIESKSSTIITEQIKIVSPKLIDFFRNIENSIPTIDNIINKLHSIQALYESGKSHELSLTIKDFYSLKKPLMEWINSNELLFFMLQKSHIEYIQKYITPSSGNNITIEEHMSNISLEIILFNEILEIFHQIVKIKSPVNY